MAQAHPLLTLVQGAARDRPFPMGWVVLAALGLSGVLWMAIIAFSAILLQLAPHS